MNNYKKETEKYLEESSKLFKTLRLSVSKLEKLVEEEPNKKWIEKREK